MCFYEVVLLYRIFSFSLLSSEASRYLAEVLESVNVSELEDVIEKVLDSVEKQPCKCTSVTFCKSLCIFGVPMRKNGSCVQSERSSSHI